MLTKEQEFYYRYHLLLRNGGTRLLRLLAENALDRMRMTLDQFLIGKMREIQSSRKLSPAQKNKLYPGSTQGACLDDFDITLLSILLLKYFEPDLEAKELQAVKELRNIRNSIGHSNESEMTAEIYKKERTLLIRVINDGSLNLSNDDKEILIEIQTDAHECTLHMQTVEELKEYIRLSCAALQNIQQRSDKVVEGQEHLIKTIGQTNITVQETKIEVMETKTEVLVVKQTQQEHSEMLQKLINLCEQPFSQRRRSVEIPALSCIISIIALDQTTACDAEHLLLHEFETFMAKSLSESSSPDKLKQCVEDFLKNIHKLQVTVDKVERSSIVLRLKVASLLDIKSLSEYLSSKRCQQLLREMSTVLTDITGNSVSITAYIDQLSLEHIISHICREYDIDMSEIGQYSCDSTTKQLLLGTQEQSKTESIQMWAPRLSEDLNGAFQFSEFQGAADETYLTVILLGKFGDFCKASDLLMKNRNKLTPRACDEMVKYALVPVYGKYEVEKIVLKSVLKGQSMLVTEANVKMFVRKTAHELAKKIKEDPQLPESDPEVAEVEKCTIDCILSSAPVVEETIVNDPIHGEIELPEICVKIIDTPEFQRLRCIKQLGTTYFVYPGAAHNRFEHSIGVFYLAGQLLTAIRRRQPELGLTDNDILLVQIAGLLHDLGHGPFSHMFESVVLPKLQERKESGRAFQHEELSVMMFEHLLSQHDIPFEKDDIKFIQELIQGPPKDWTFEKWLETKSDGTKGYEKWLETKSPGATEEMFLYEKWLETTKHGTTKKMFLYEVVNNKRNEIDVDKWDYFARDCHMLGIGNNFDHKRCIAIARVINVDGQWQICYRDKEYNSLLEMFHTRYQLHKKAYQHKACNGIEMMMAEALIDAAPYIKLPRKQDKKGEDGKESKEEKMDREDKLDKDVEEGKKTTVSVIEMMSELEKYMDAYTLLTDDIFNRILNSSKPELSHSKKLFTRIFERDLYQCVKEKSVEGSQSEVTVRQLKTMFKETGLKERDDFLIDLIKLNYGNGTENPMDKVKFYSKKNPNAIIPLEKVNEKVSLLIPRKWEEMLIRVYSTNKDTEEMVEKACDRWDGKQRES